MGAKSGTQNRLAKPRSVLSLATIGLLAACGAADGVGRSEGPASTAPPIANDSATPTSVEVEAPESAEVAPSSTLQSTPTSSIASAETVSPVSVPAPPAPDGPSTGGNELDWYLGSVLPPDVLIGAQASHLAAVAQCMSVQGFELQVEPLQYSSEMRLRYEEPTAFAEAYGYGFFAVDVERVASIDELDPESPDAVPPTDKWVAARDDCESQHPYPLVDNLAPVGVSNMAYELQLELLESDPEYLGAVEDWIACMALDQPTVTTADGALDLIASRLSEYPNATEFDSGPGIYIIGDDDLAELVEFERAVYGLDAACGVESGRYEAERRIARQVIDTIRDETGYAGVVLDSLP